MIALIAATIAEAGPLLELFDAHWWHREPFLTFRFDASGVRPDGIVIISGMGPAAAAAATEYAIAEGGAKTIINFGVCGSLAISSDLRHPVATILAITQVQDGDSASGGSILLDPGPWPQLPQARLVSVAKPVFGGDRRDRLAQVGDLVDLEGFSIARVAFEHQLACLLIKGVTDAAAHGDRELLHQNLAAVSVKVAAVVAAGLSAPGSIRRGVEAPRRKLGARPGRVDKATAGG